jgi:broad specificity phosphatase PhoE
MHIVLIRHGTRIDKSKPGISPEQSEVSLIPASEKPKTNLKLMPPEIDELEIESFNWLSNFDPPLNQIVASHEMEGAYKRIANNVLGNHKADKIMIHSSPYNRCIQTSELLLNKLKNSKLVDDKTLTKLRVDQALSEWLNENYNLKYLPPNDDGYSMINNVNAYLNQPVDDNSCNGDFNFKTRNQLREVKDPMWSYNQLGHCGEYGESASSFTRRCFNYLINLLQFYYTRQNSEADKHMVVFIISHGAVISTLLQILLGRSVFNEIPLCTPIYFKQSEKRRSIFKLKDYDFNLFNLLSPSSDQKFYKILDTPIDLTKLDPDNLRSELTIGTTGYTTIIQSIPKNLESPKLTIPIKTRKRRNTINIGEQEKENSENEGIESLKQTRSSKQLYLLNKDTSEEKVIDLDKLHSYFGSGTETETESEDELEHIININDFDDHGKSLKDNVYKGSITSLSSFNEENKSKFQLNEKNFYSKTLPIKNDPYSHFFLSRSSTVDDEMSDYDGISMSRRSSHGIVGTSLNRFSSMNKEINNNDNYFNNNNSTETIDEIDSDNYNDNYNDNDDNILSFGTRDRVNKVLDKEIDKLIVNSKKENDENAVINGTYRNISFGSNSKSILNDKENQISNNNNNSNTFLAVPKLISTRNMNLLVRGGSDSEDQLNNSANEKQSSPNSLGKILFGQTMKIHELNNKYDEEEEEEEEKEEDDWFGGFSR